MFVVSALFSRFVYDFTLFCLTFFINMCLEAKEEKEEKEEGEEEEEEDHT